MPIDPQVQAFLDELVRLGLPPLHELAPTARDVADNAPENAKPRARSPRLPAGCNRRSMGQA